MRVEWVRMWMDLHGVGYMSFCVNRFPPDVFGQELMERFVKKRCFLIRDMVDFGFVLILVPING